MQMMATNKEKNEEREQKKSKRKKVKKKKKSINRCGVLRRVPHLQRNR